MLSKFKVPFLLLFHCLLCQTGQKNSKSGCLPWMLLYMLAPVRVARYLKSCFCDAYLTCVGFYALMQVVIYLFFLFPWGRFCSLFFIVTFCYNKRLCCTVGCWCLERSFSQFIFSWDLYAFCTFKWISIKVYLSLQVQLLGKHWMLPNDSFNLYLQKNSLLCSWSQDIYCHKAW